jgi:hypothetical protein
MILTYKDHALGFHIRHLTLCFYQQVTPYRCLEKSLRKLMETRVATRRNVGVIFDVRRLRRCAASLCEYFDLFWID